MALPILATEFYEIKQMSKMYPKRGNEAGKGSREQVLGGAVLSCTREDLGWVLENFSSLKGL